MSINAKMITIARESRGLNQTELAKRMGVSVSNISRYEDGTFEIKEEILNKLSHELNYPISFFSQDFLILPPNVHYRKRLTLAASIVRKADAVMNIYRSNIEKMLRTIDLDTSSIPVVDDKYGSPRRIAAYLRSYWRVEKGPIKDLVSLVERHGIMVIMIDFGTDKIDGRSMMTEDGHPVIFLNKLFSGERQRMTLSHELGHIIMHLKTIPTFARDEEAEAFEFAAEFLMPENEIRADFTAKMTLEKLAYLKRIWKVSMAALLNWCEKLNCITANQSRYLWSQLSAKGYRKLEPIPIAIDNPTLISRMVNLYIQSIELPNEVAQTEVAKIFHLNIEEFKEYFVKPVVKLRIA